MNTLSFLCTAQMMTFALVFLRISCIGMSQRGLSEWILTLAISTLPPANESRFAAEGKRIILDISLAVSYSGLTVMLIPRSFLRNCD